MSETDLDAAREKARCLGDHIYACREHACHTDEHDAAIAVVINDAVSLAALVLLMAKELDTIRPVYEAAVVRHKAYFGASSIRAAKCKATMNLNKATDRARRS